MSSIRRRTLTLIIGLLLGGLLIISLLNLHDSRHEIAEVYDAQLAQNARLLQGVMRMPVAVGEQAALYQAFNKALGEAAPKIDGHPYERKIAFQVWDEHNALLVQTASAPRFAAPPTQAGFSDVTDLKQRTWRGFVLLDAQHQLRIWVGERDDVRADLVQRIVRHTLWPNVIGSLILAVLVWLAIGWGLQPLADLASKLRARHAGSLEPLHLLPLPSELEPMQSALNRMLAQIEQVLARERRFIADAAHEMRTPLAVLRVHAQNLLETGSAEQQAQSLHYLISGVDRTTRLVNQLLTMARLEPRASSAALPAVDLQASVRESLVQLTAWLLDKGLELEFDVQPGDYHARVDVGWVTIALHNLLSNAAHVSPPGATLSVTLSSTPSHFSLSVADRGPGIAEADRERVFERFFSSGNDQGVGLGLTIVQTIAERLGGDVRLDNRADGGLTATLRIARR